MVPSLRSTRATSGQTFCQSNQCAACADIGVEVSWIKDAEASWLPDVIKSTLPSSRGILSAGDLIDSIRSDKPCVLKFCAACSIILVPGSIPMIRLNGVSSTVACPTILKRFDRLLNLLITTFTYQYRILDRRQCPIVHWKYARDTGTKTHTIDEGKSVWLVFIMIRNMTS